MRKTIIFILTLICLSGCTEEKADVDNQANDREMEQDGRSSEPDSTIDNRQGDILEKTPYTNVAVFLYKTKNKFDQFQDLSYSENNYIELVIDTRKHAKHFAAIEENSDVVEQLDGLAEKAVELQHEFDREKRIPLMDELNQFTSNLIQLVDADGEYVNKRDYPYNIPELDNLVVWLNSVKSHIRKEEYDSFDQNFEVFLAASMEQYAEHFASMGSYLSVKDKLIELRDTSASIREEKEKEARMEKLKKAEALIDQMLDNEEIHIDWTIIVEGDEVETNDLTCNDVTRIEIPSHLVEICMVYEKLGPLSDEQLEIFHNESDPLLPRFVYSSDTPLGQDGFGEEMKDNGEYLLHAYLTWRTDLKPNAKGEFKRLNQTKDFDDFFQLDGDSVDVYYEPSRPIKGDSGGGSTLLDAIEYEITVVTRMKHLNLAEPFNHWADDTAQLFIEAKQFYEKEQYKESYLKYYEGLKRIHDLYFTIPETNLYDYKHY